MLKPRTSLFALLFPLTLTLCAAAPPEEGAEVRAGAGYDYFEYESGGCGTPAYVNRAHEGRATASYSYRTQEGWTAVGEGSLGVARVTDSTLDTPPEELDPDDDLNGNQEGRQIQSGLIAARAGYHHDYFGIEGGLGIGANLVADFSDDIVFFPSARVWAGAPDYIYLYGSGGTAPGTAGYFPFEIGLGHASDAFRLEVGAGGPSAGVVHGQLPIGEEAWVGAKLHFSAFESSRTETLYAAGALLTFSTSL